MRDKSNLKIIRDMSTVHGMCRIDTRPFKPAIDFPAPRCGDVPFMKCQVAISRCTLTFSVQLHVSRNGYSQSSMQIPITAKPRTWGHLAHSEVP